MTTTNLVTFDFEYISLFQLENTIFGSNTFLLNFIFQLLIELGIPFWSNFILPKGTSEIIFIYTKK